MKNNDIILGQTYNKKEKKYEGRKRVNFLKTFPIVFQVESFE